MLRQLETQEVEVNGTRFFITPFGAFKAAKLSGDLAAVAAPVLVSIAPLLKSDQNIMDMDANAVASAISGCSNIDGDKIEKLLRVLLLGDNVAVETVSDEGEVETKRLTADLADEIFCGNVQNMFVLAFHVVKLNFSDFFAKLPNQFGEVKLERKKRKRV